MDTEGSPIGGSSGTPGDGSTQSPSMSDRGSDDDDPLSQGFKIKPLQEMSHTEMQKELVHRGLKAKGKKKDLIARIAAARERQSTGGRASSSPSTFGGFASIDTQLTQGFDNPGGHQEGEQENNAPDATTMPDTSAEPKTESKSKRRRGHQGVARNHAAPSPELLIRRIAASRLGAPPGCPTLSTSVIA